MILHLIITFVVLISASNVISSPVSACNSEISFRDAKSCNKFYTCKKNGKYWEFVENYCLDSQNLYFEPEINGCTTLSKLVTKCPQNTFPADSSSDDHLSSYRRRGRDLTPMFAPGQPIIAPDQPIIAPDQPIIAPDQPIIAPDRPIIAPAQAFDPYNLEHLDRNLNPADIDPYLMNRELRGDFENEKPSIGLVPEVEEKDSSNSATLDPMKPTELNRNEKPALRTLDPMKPTELNKNEKPAIRTLDPMKPTELNKNEKPALRTLDQMKPTELNKNEKPAIRTLDQMKPNELNKNEHSDLVNHGSEKTEKHENDPKFTSSRKPGFKFGDKDKSSKARKNGSGSLRPRKPGKLDKKYNEKLGTKRRVKNKVNSAKRKKNWVTIFVRGCSSGPYDDDDEEEDEEEDDQSYEQSFEQPDEQPDEQLEEDENGDQTNRELDNKDKTTNNNKSADSNDLDQDTGKSTDTKPNLNDGASENPRDLSKNCSCDNHTATSKPDSDNSNNLTGNSNSASDTGNNLRGSSTTSTTPSSTPEQSTTEALRKLTTLADRSTTPFKPQTSTTSTSTTSTSTTSTSTTPASTTLKKTTEKPTTPKQTTSKPRSKIVVIPKTFKNPRNENPNATPDEVQKALKQFLDSLKKRSRVSEEYEEQLTAIFKEKVEENKRKEHGSSETHILREPETLEPEILEPAVRSLPQSRKPSVRKIEESLHVDNLDAAIDYYANLASDKSENQS